MRKIQIEAVVNDTDDKIAVLFRANGFKDKSLISTYELLGMLDNIFSTLKKGVQDKMNNIVKDLSKNE